MNKEIINGYVYSIFIYKNYLYMFNSLILIFVTG